LGRLLPIVFLKYPFCPEKLYFFNDKTQNFTVAAGKASPGISGTIVVVAYLRPATLLPAYGKLTSAENSLGRKQSFSKSPR